MRKMILLAAMSAIATMMLAAAPALAQNQGGGPDARTAFCQIPPGNPENARIIIIGDPAPGGNIPGFVVDEDVTREEARELRGDPCGPGVDGPDDGDNGNNNNGNNNNRDNNNRDNNGGSNDVVPAFEISQESEQEAESGDIDQSFTVTGGGDNSNQCAGIQGVANTGNAQNQLGLTQFGSEADDFSFEDSGSSINVSPSNTTTCDQQVNQSASAFGS